VTLRADLTTRGSSPTLALNCYEPLSDLVRYGPVGISHQS
jgi:hypothetical protein